MEPTADDRVILFLIGLSAAASALLLFWAH